MAPTQDGGPSILEFTRLLTMQAQRMGVDDADSCHEIYNLSKAFIVISSIRAVELNIGYILD